MIFQIYKALTDQPLVLNVLKGEGPFTVFAPLNSAFAGLDLSNVDVARVLKNHVFAGAAVFSGDLKESQTITAVGNGKLKITKDADGTVMVNGAKVVIADVKASNGVIHIIDQVLIPLGSIVETAVATPSLSTLVAILTSPGYESVLTGLGGQGFFDTMPAVWAPFTVFAPVNTAFSNVDGVNPADVDAVTDVIKYHVIAGDLFAGDIAEEVVQELWTLQGDKLRIKKDVDGTVYVNDAKVLVADVKASNGVVHVIDQVLIPGMSEPDDSPISNGKVSLNALRWEAINDSVMGGISVSSAKLIEEDGKPVINFKGSITTDSNGGFTNVYGRTQSTMDLSGCDGVSLMAKKDNDLKERFEFSLASGQQSMWSGSDSQYVNFYPTSEWQLFEFEFSDFQEVNGFGSFGSSTSKFDLSAVNVVGLKRSAFLDGLNKDPEFKSGAFSLKIADVMCMGGSQPSEVAEASETSIELTELTDMQWEVINDSVMGGISNSNVKVVSDSTLVFSGYTTTDSNGGFTNANGRPSAPVDVSKCKTIHFDAKGDSSQRYTISLMSGEMSFFGTVPSVIADFYPPTEWDTVSVDLDAFDPVQSWRGGDSADFDKSKMSILGISRSAFLSGGFQKDPNFVSGPFELMIRNFRCT